MIDYQHLSEEYIKCYTDKSRIYMIRNYLKTYDGTQGKEVAFGLFPRQQLIKETRLQQVDFESEIRYGMKNISEATKYVESSRKEIYDIKKQLEVIFKDYPQYKDLLADFEKIEKELDRQEMEIIYLNKPIKVGIPINIKQII